MDMGTFRGVLTAVLMALFVGLVLWAYSRRRDDEFSAAALLPLDDDRMPPRSGSGTEEARCAQDTRESHGHSTETD